MLKKTLKRGKLTNNQSAQFRVSFLKDKIYSQLYYNTNFISKHFRGDAGIVRAINYLESEEYKSIFPSIVEAECIGERQHKYGNPRIMSTK